MQPSKLKIAAIVLAGGSGQRYGAADLPKQYASLMGKAVMAHCLGTILESKAVTMVQPVIRSHDLKTFSEIATEFAHDPRLAAPVMGGKERQNSVLAGLVALQQQSPSLVMIHDGARPLLRLELIERLVVAWLEEWQEGTAPHQSAVGVIPTLAMSDTVKFAADGVIEKTLERSQLWRAQTPQLFDYQKLLAAHQNEQGKSIPSQFSDDAALMEANGYRVRHIRGDDDNIKITQASDLRLATFYFLQQKGDAVASPSSLSSSPPFDMRVGNGFDVHEFGEGDRVTLCGVTIPHSRALVGHSDADVGLHAITDAVLGAAALGDIGSHFPPSDPQWRGADSAQFLVHAQQAVRAIGGTIHHIDVTLICEEPKISNHRIAMQQRIASILAMPPERVSVKATTTEGLGFTGRREGIAAMATATVYFSLYSDSK